jgi:predicted PurR-regulated permease PerM
MDDSERSSAHLAYRAVLLAAALLVFGLVFRQLLTLMLAVLMTVIIAIPIAAVATRLQRRGVPRPLGAMIALLGAITAIALLVYLLIPPFVDETNRFVDDVPGIVNDLETRVTDITGAQPSEVGDKVQEFVQGYTDDPARLIGPITSIGLSVAGVLGALILMLITAFYMAIRPEPLVDGMLRLVPPPRRAHGRRVLERVRQAWIGWMAGVTVDMLVTGTLLYVGLRLVGLNFAVFFAVLTALLTLVPYFGAIAGALPPVLFALTDSPGKALVVLAVYVVVQQVESKVTIPLIMSQTVRLHPAVIAIGVLVVARLFGVVGLLVAVPILSLVTIGVEELWVKPLEQADRRRGSPAGLELHDGDDRTGEHEDHDQDLHDDPEAGELQTRATR